MGQETHYYFFIKSKALSEDKNKKTTEKCRVKVNNTSVVK